MSRRVGRPVDRRWPARTATGDCLGALAQPVLETVVQHDGAAGGVVRDVRAHCLTLGRFLRRDRWIEQLRPVPEREERFLHNLLGDLSVTGETERDGVDAADVPVVERREGLLRAVRHGADERGVLGLADPALRHVLRVPVLGGFGVVAGRGASGAAGASRNRS